jgi:hypothetical protein
MNKPNLRAEAPPPADHAAMGSLCKLSETLFVFGEPLLSKLGDDAPLAARKQAMQLVITVWNAGAMAMPQWGEPELVLQLEQMLAQPAIASPMRDLLQQLLVRRRELFGGDSRAVGEWALIPQPDAGWVLRCSAHLPAGTTPAGRQSFWRQAQSASELLD